MKNHLLGTSTALFAGEPAYLHLDEVAASGIKLLEIGLDSQVNVTAAMVSKLGQALVGYSLSVWSIHLPFGDDCDISSTQPQQRAQAVALLCSLADAAIPTLHPTLAVIHASFEPIPAQERPARMAACKQSLSALVRHLGTAGVGLAVECLPRTCLGNCSDEIEELLEAVPGLQVCFDFNHLTIQSPYEFAGKLASRIVTTHISDFDGINEKHWLMGKGCLDFARLAKTLTDGGYSGPWMFEIGRNNGNPTVTASIISDSWHALMNEQYI